jgi:hypothetical protein
MGLESLTPLETRINGATTYDPEPRNTKGARAMHCIGNGILLGGRATFLLGPTGFPKNKIILQTLHIYFGAVICGIQGHERTERFSILFHPLQLLLQVILHNILIYTRN